MTPDETALVIPVGGLPPVMEDLRMRHDPTARAGVPAHITILYPFVEPDLVSMSKLEAMLRGFSAFAYSLVAMRTFDDGTVYLAPEPEQPFIVMCDAVSTRFGIQPYRGAFDVVVPHLTVAQAVDDVECRRIATLLEPMLPLRARATEAWLMVGHTERLWRMVRALPLSR